MDVGAALNAAWDRTRLLLFEHRSWGRWGSFALLTFLTGGGGNGGGNLNIPSPPSDSDSRRSGAAAVPAAAAASLAGMGGAEWAIVVGVFLLVLALVLVFAWLGGIARLVMTESILRDRHAIVEPFQRLGHLGLSSFLWQLAFGLICVAVLLALVGSFVAGGYFVGFDGARVLPIVLMAIFVGLPLLFVWIVVVTVVNNLHDEVISPVMYLQETHAMAAWGILLPNLKCRWKDWLVYLAVRLAVAIGAGMISLLALVLGILLVGALVGLLVGVPTFLLYLALDHAAVAIVGAVAAALLAIPALMALLFAVATPVAVFSRCYAMAGLGQCLPEYQALGPAPGPNAMVPAPAGPSAMPPGPAETNGMPPGPAETNVMPPGPADRPEEPGPGGETPSWRRPPS